MIDTDKYEEFENAMNEGRIERVHCLWALAEVKRLREENKELEEFLNKSHAANKIRHEQLVRAQKWAYKQVCHNDSAMMDYDDYVWGEEDVDISN